MSRPRLIYRLAAWVLDRYLTRRGLFMVMRQGGGLGEQVAMTAVPESLPEGMRAIVVTDFPEFFENNANVARIIDLTTASNFLRRRLSRLTKVGGRWHGYFDYQNPEFDSYLASQRETGMLRHLIELNTEHFARADWFSPFTSPRVYVPEHERIGVRNHFNLPQRYFVIHSEGKVTWTPNKELGGQKMQEICDRVCSALEVPAVQVGLADDFRLKGALDLRGRPGLQELAAVFAEAAFTVCQEGFYTHLSAAVQVPNFTIYTGFNAPEISAYHEVTAIYLEPQVSCAPCWKTEPCPVDGFPCATGLTADKIASVILSGVLRKGGPAD